MTQTNLLAPQDKTVLVGGSFECNGASSPTTASGSGYTVARTGTGIHQVTLAGIYGRVLAPLVGEGPYTGGVGHSTFELRVTDIAHNGSTFSVTTFSGTTAVDTDDLVVVFQCLASEHDRAF